MYDFLFFMHISAIIAPYIVQLLWTCSTYVRNLTIWIMASNRAFRIGGALPVSRGCIGSVAAMAVITKSPYDTKEYR